MILVITWQSYVVLREYLQYLFAGSLTVTVWPMSFHHSNEVWETDTCGRGSAGTSLQAQHRPAGVRVSPLAMHTDIFGATILGLLFSDLMPIVAVHYYCSSGRD